MLELIITRHAKSSWNHPELTDYERPLKKRGRQDAQRMADWLNKQGLKPERIVTSGAYRAVKTAEIIAKHLKRKPPFKLTDKLYFSSSKTHLEVLRKCRDADECILMVGHNPVISSFAEKLCNEGLGEIPTCAMVRIQFKKKHWKDIQFGDGKVIAYQTPKKLR